MQRKTSQHREISWPKCSKVFESPRVDFDFAIVGYTVLGRETKNADACMVRDKARRD